MKTRGPRRRPAGATPRRRPMAAASRRSTSMAAEASFPPTFRIKSILVPIDFSEYSKKALRYAVRFAKEFGASLTLLHVFEPLIQPPEGYGVLQVPVIDGGALQKEAAARLTSLAQEEIEELVPVKSVVRSGRPYNEIVMDAKERKVDLIIIATHGYTGLTHLLLGSTAERVVRHAPCPVLTVREPEKEFV